MLREDLQKVLDEYLDARKNNGKTSAPIAHYITKDIREHMNKLLDSNKYGWGSSAGLGNLAEIPWIDFGIKNIPNDGKIHNVNVAYFFKSDMSGVYLVLRVFYFGDLERKYGKYLSDYLKTKSIHIREFLDESEYETDDYLKTIDLKSNKATSKLHTSGVIYSKFYEKSNLPSEEILEKDLFDFLNMLETVEFNYSDNMYLTVDEWIAALEDENLIDTRILNVLEIM